MAGGGRRTENWNKDNPTGGEVYPPRHVPQSSLAHMYLQALKTCEMELEMSLKQKLGAEQEARLARLEVDGLAQARDWWDHTLARSSFSSLN